MDIIDYIKGKLKGRDANEFEMESQDDPFLSDAIEGYNSVGGNHIDNLSTLRNRINSKYKHEKKGINFVHILITFILLLISIVAVRIIDINNENQQKFAFKNSYYIDSLNYNPNNLLEISKPINGLGAYNNYLTDGLNVFLESRGKVMGDYIEICFKVGDNGKPYNIVLVHGIYSDLDGYVIELLYRGDSWTKSDNNCIRISFK